MLRCEACGRRTSRPHEACTGSIPDTGPDRAERDGDEAPRSIPAIAGFTVGEPIGRGGYGVVYAAVRDSDGAATAIKVAQTGRLTANDRLRHEGKVLAAIGPPHVPAVYAAGALEGGAAYVAMERIMAPTLAAYMEGWDEPLNEGICAAADVLLEALEAIHTAGFFHRDLKPDNIFYDPSPPRATLIDFGLGKATVRHADSSALTGAGVVLGTVEYMAPEQCEPDAAVDKRADIYAFGVILYEMLTTRPPFWGAPSAVRLAHQMRRPPRPSQFVDVSAAVEDVVLRCLAKDPAQRFQRASEVRTALAEAWAAPVSFRPRTPAVSVIAAEAPAAAAVEARSSGRGDAGRRDRDPARMPVLYFHSDDDLGLIRRAVTRVGGRIAHSAGERYAVVLVDNGDAQFGHRAVDAAEQLVTARLCRAVYVDYLQLSSRARPDGGVRYFSPRFTRDASYPRPDEIGVRLSDASQAALAARASVSLVGRDALLDALVATAGAAAREHATAVMTVIGDVGVGKSAVAEALATRLAGDPASFEVVSLRGAPPGEGRRRGLRQLLQALVATARAPDATQAAACLESVLPPALAAELAPAFSLAMGWTRPVDSVIHGFAAAPGALRVAVMRMTGEVLRHRARTRPLAIVLDDAHVVGDDVLDALEYAVTSGDGAPAPLVICAFARPALRDGRPSFVELAGEDGRYVLEPLDAPSAAARCRALLAPAEDVPEQVIAGLVLRARAVPLLLVELVQRLKRDGVVRKRTTGAAWFLATDEVDRHSDTPLLSALAQAEMGALSAELAAHAQLLSLLGDAVTPREYAGVLRALEAAGMGPQFPLDAYASLERLRALDVLVISDDDGRDGDGRDSEEGPLAAITQPLRFRHGLLREVVAQMVPSALRAAIHRAAYSHYLARRGRGHGDDELELARLAHHAAASGMAEDAARCYLELAAASRRRHEYIEAERHYTSALALLAADDARSRMTALHGRARMRYRVGRYQDSLADFAAARALAERARDGALVNILLDEATALDWIDRHDASRALVERAAALAAEVAAPDAALVAAKLCLGAGRGAWRSGDFATARLQLEEAARRAEAVGNAGYETLVVAMLILGPILVAEGETAAAAEVFARTVALCREHGDLLHLAAALNNRRHVWTTRGARAELVEDAQRIIEIGRSIGMVGFEFGASYNVAEYLLAVGDVEAAQPWAARALRCEERRAAAAGTGRPLAALLCARIAYHADRVSDVRTLSAAIDAGQREARAAAREEACLPESEALLLEALIIADRGDDASAAWQELASRAAGVAGPSLEAEVWDMAALWAARCGEVGLARTWLSRALERAGTSALTDRLHGRRVALERES